MSKRRRYRVSLWDRIRTFFGNYWYDFKCWTWHRYRTVKPTTLPGHGWIDRDELMLHCAFQCLVDFVEKEKRPDPGPDFETYKQGWGDSVSDEYLLEQRKIDTEILDLYHWWKKDYPELKNTLNNDTYDDINKMFHRLIEIRAYLWT